jgi:hypothetical protein
MNSLTQKFFNGIVSEIPKRVQATPPNVSTSNIVDIPEFMKKRAIVVSQEYAERQARLYEKARLTRWQKLKRKILLLFFYEE